MLICEHVGVVVLQRTNTKEGERARTAAGHRAQRRILVRAIIEHALLYSVHADDQFCVEVTISIRISTENQMSSRLEIAEPVFDLGSLGEEVTARYLRHGIFRFPLLQGS